MRNNCLNSPVHELHVNPMHRKGNNLVKVPRITNLFMILRIDMIMRKEKIEKQKRQSKDENI